MKTITDCEEATSCLHAAMIRGDDINDIKKAFEGCLVSHLGIALSGCMWDYCGAVVNYEVVAVEVTT